MAAPAWVIAVVLVVNAGLLAFVALRPVRPEASQPPDVATGAAHTPPPDVRIPVPAGQPKWLVAAEAAVSAARSTVRPPPVEAPRRPPGMGDEEWSGVVASADSVLSRLGGQSKMLDEASAVTAATVLDAGRGPFGQVYPRCERAYVREALIDPAAKHTPATIRGLVKIQAVYRQLLDEDARRELAARPRVGERKRLYAQFAAAANLSAAWTPLVAWEDLPPHAMAALPGVCNRIGDNGLSVATADEIGWLLAADAVEFVAASVDAEKRK